MSTESDPCTKATSHKDGQRREKRGVIERDRGDNRLMGVGAELEERRGSGGREVKRGRD